MMHSPPDPPSGAPFDWESCIQAARSGSAAALGRLLEACSPYLLALAHRELDADLRAKADPTDIVQDTFLDAQRYFPHFQGGAEQDVRAWLRRVLLNNVGDLRQRYRGAGKREVGREASLDDARSGVQRRASELPDDAPPPSAYVYRREEEARVEAALARAPESYRQVIVLRHREQLSFAKIGQLMHRSEDAVQKLWTRAIEHLRGELGDEA